MARGAIAMALVALVAGVVGYSLHPRPPAETNAPAAVNAPAPIAPLPMPEAPPAALDRAGFLEAAAKAASDYAAGSAQPLAADLVGRQFELRIPFGCFGPAAAGAEGQTYWRDDRAHHAVTVGVRAQDWTAAPWRGALDPHAEAEAIEGFWIPRPWLFQDHCPRAGGAAAAAAAGPTVGLAALYAKEGSRTERRGEKPYEITRPTADGAAPPGPFVLVLAGRIAGYDDGAAFRCLPTAPDQRPACLAGVEFTRVRIEAAKGGEVLGQWDG
jgi:hypothetical protein